MARAPPSARVCCHESAAMSAATSVAMSGRYVCHHLYHAVLCQPATMSSTTPTTMSPTLPLHCPVLLADLVCHVPGGGCSPSLLPGKCGDVRYRASVCYQANVAMSRRVEPSPQPCSSSWERVRGPRSSATPRRACCGGITPSCLPWSQMRRRDGSASILAPLSSAECVDGCSERESRDFVASGRIAGTTRHRFGAEMWRETADRI